MKRGPKKAEQNFRKHKVCFEEAKTVFDDPFSLTFPDPDHSVDEQRYFNIGVSARGRVLVVIHTEREFDIRIISCRKAAPSERRVYAASINKYTAPDIRSRSRQMVQLSDIAKSGTPLARARHMTSTIDEAQMARLIREYGPINREHHVLHVSAESEKWWRDVRAKGRQSEVILALQRPGGRVLLHTKTFYPPGTYRLTSGGVKSGEKLKKAVRRESYEELGLKVRIERFLGAITYTFQHGDETIPFASYVFVVSGDGEPHPTDPGERISGYREVPWTNLPAVADALEAVPPDWIDWGRFRAIGHRFVGRLVLGCSNPGKPGGPNPEEDTKGSAIYVEEPLNVGNGTVIDSVSPQGRFGVAFEDDGATGYFYALDVTRDENPILDALHIYNVESVVDRDVRSTLQILWSGDGRKAALIINDYVHAIFDFESKRGYCRTSFPPPDTRWTQYSHEWEDSALELFE